MQIGRPDWLAEWAAGSQDGQAMTLVAASSSANYTALDRLDHQPLSSCSARVSEAPSDAVYLRIEPSSTGLWVWRPARLLSPWAASQSTPWCRRKERRRAICFSILPPGSLRQTGGGGLRLMRSPGLVGTLSFFGHSGPCPVPFISRRDPIRSRDDDMATTKLLPARPSNHRPDYRGLGSRGWRGFWCSEQTR